MDEVERIVRGLTKAQREAVKDGYIGDQSIMTVRALREKGLFELVIDSPNGRAGFMHLTAPGLRVRAALKEAGE